MDLILVRALGEFVWLLGLVYPLLELFNFLEPLIYSRGRRLRADGHPRTSSRNEGIKREPATTEKNKAKQNEDVKDRQLWIPSGQKVLQNGNAECPREQSRVQACEKAKRQE